MNSRSRAAIGDSVGSIVTTNWVGRNLTSLNSYRRITFNFDGSKAVRSTARVSGYRSSDTVCDLHSKLADCAVPLPLAARTNRTMKTTANTRADTRKSLKVPIAPNVLRSSTIREAPSLVHNLV